MRDYMIQHDLYTTEQLEQGFITRDIIVPSNYQQAINSEQRQEWKQARDEEMISLKQNNTWTLSPLPPGKHAIDSMWLFTLKYDELGNVSKHKA